MIQWVRLLTVSTFMKISIGEFYLQTTYDHKADLGSARLSLKGMGVQVKRCSKYGEIGHYKNTYRNL